MAQKPTNEELKTIDLLYQIVQPTKSMVFDHREDEVDSSFKCEECKRDIKTKKGLCWTCFEAFML
jgi:predicted amidophosphoribosyltransferase